MITENESIDMMAELFIDKQRVTSVDYRAPLPIPKEELVKSLLGRGVYSEKNLDFPSALKCYLAAIKAPKDDIDTAYWSFNNTGFCLNYFRRFSEAEQHLREAVRILPGRYNAWKNLGVSLEWQGQYEEAAECFLKAITISKGEPRSRLHLSRLLERHPTLKKVPCFC